MICKIKFPANVWAIQYLALTCVKSWLAQFPYVKDEACSIDTGELVTEIDDFGMFAGV